MVRPHKYLGGGTESHATREKIHHRPLRLGRLYRAEQNHENNHGGEISVAKKAASEAWRELMTEDELVLYDQDPTERFKTHDPDHVRREKNHIRYNEKYVQHEPGNQNCDNTFRHVLADEDDSRAEPETPIMATATSRKLINNPPADPAVAQAEKFLVEAIAALKEVPANCAICGEFMDGRQKRFGTDMIRSRAPPS
jgi:hypothetical protein